MLARLEVPQTLPIKSQLNRLPFHNLSAPLSPLFATPTDSVHLSDSTPLTRPLFSYSYALLRTSRQLISFPSNVLRTLWLKHRAEAWPLQEPSESGTEVEAGLVFLGTLNEINRKTNSAERDGLEQSPGVPAFDESRSGRGAGRKRRADVGRSRSESNSGIGPAPRSGVSETFARGEKAHRFRAAE